MSTAVIIPAAGYSTRFGCCKLSYPFKKNRPLLVATIESVSKVFQDVFVILRQEQTFLQQQVRSVGGRVVVNQNNNRQAMGDNIAIGVQCCRHYDFVTILLGDMPMIQPSTFELIDTVDKKSCSIIVPYFQNRQGHPVTFGRDYFELLCSLSGPKGAKAIIQSHRDRVTKIATQDNGVVFDIDTPNSLIQASRGLE